MTRSSSHTVPQVLSALSRVGQAVRLAPGASAQTVAAAESAVGRALPSEVVELYRAADGLELGGGELQLYPLLGTDEELGVVEAAATYRSWDWVIPQELVLLGSDGGDGAIGVWTPAGARRSTVVQAVMSLDGRPAMAVLGTSLAGFLAAWAAYYLPLALGETEGVATCLDELGVPSGLRDGESEFDDEHLHALLAWASPDLPDDEPDPYARPVDPDVLTRLSTR
ncbi:SMI1/KNR4 family protein [Ornithinimicrobium sufpigmenti]|uniref:SMI1/KNR4 family protein n=1 Tax=Ornithinimicrobium sufpigmenti TaxID=2508882 RepID=UPI001035EDF0|nr:MULTISPECIES: SMI1/KNR4 family protein [unclassified Ornithinimicrobium]